MLETIPVTEARNKFLPLLDRIETGSYRFNITRHGKPVAVILSYEDYQRMAETLKLMESRNFSQRLTRGLEQAKGGELIDFSEADRG
jgi:antitoxin YefM